MAALRAERVFSKLGEEIPRQHGCCVATRRVRAMPCACCDPAGGRGRPSPRRPYESQGAHMDSGSLKARGAALCHRQRRDGEPYWGNPSALDDRVEIQRIRRRGVGSVELNEPAYPSACPRHPDSGAVLLSLNGVLRAGCGAFFLGFGARPEVVHFCQIAFSRGFPCFCQQCLDPRKAACEFGVCSAQGGFGVDM